MPEVQLKTDEKGAPVLVDGQPVVLINGKEETLGNLVEKQTKLSGDLDRLRPQAARVAELETKLRDYEGLDPKKAREWEGELKKLRSETEAAKHGTTDEAVEKLVTERFGRRLEDETAKVTSIEAKWREEKAAREKTEERLRGRAIDTEVSIGAGSLEGFIPEALEDARIQARLTFQLNKDGDPEARDSNGGPIFGPDGKTPLTIREWLAGTRKTKPHWWKAGVNGGGAAGGADRAGGKVMKRTEFEVLPASEQSKRSQEGWTLTD